MIDLRNISYRVVCVTPDGTPLDIPSVTTGLGWEDGEKDLSPRISLRVYNAEYNGKRMSQLIQPGTPIFVYYISGMEQKEAVRGTVEKWSPSYSTGSSALTIEANDIMHALRQSQDFFYFSDGVTTQAMISEVLGKWGVPFEYVGDPPNVTHNKMGFKKNYLSDILQKIFDDVKKKGGGVFFARASEGKVQILKRGTNEDIYHFDGNDNAITAKDSFDSGSIVTRVIIVGKTDKEGHQSVEATVDGKTQYGVRQAIIEHQKSKDLAQATEAANQLLKEKGGLKRKTSISAPDLPFLRKGDRIRVSAGTVLGYFFVKSVRHNAEDQKMTLTIDEDKEKNKETDTDNGLNGAETAGGNEEAVQTETDASETSEATEDDVS